MKIALVSNPSRDIGLKESKKTAEKLIKLGAQVFTDSEGISGATVIENTDSLFKEADIAVVIGGDGTLLSAAQLGAKYDVPLLGLNMGRLGFLVELEKDDTDLYEKIINGDYDIESRMMLSAKVERDGKEIYSGDALNDIVVSKGLLSKMINLELKIDSVLASDYYADGLIISTPTGSTAYSLSAGGPIVAPALDAIVVTPVCAHTVTSRPMVISDSQSVEITVKFYHNEDVRLSRDGADNVVLLDNDKITVTKSDKKVKLIRCSSRSFFDVLNRKLSERK